MNVAEQAVTDRTVKAMFSSADFGDVKYISSGVVRPFNLRFGDAAEICNQVLLVVVHGLR